MNPDKNRWQCMHCGHLFIAGTLGHFFGPPKCPECGANRHRRAKSRVFKSISDEEYQNTLQKHQETPPQASNPNSASKIMSPEPSKTPAEKPAYKVREPKVSLEKDLILTPKTRQMLNEAIGALRHHKIIYSDWGFGAVDPLGRNMVINFYGPPGVGKTLAAEAFAGALGRPYIHLGISEIESKFVGETAKNITAAFEQAALEGAVLFFDEADTLLGARLSSVTQGIDNEINAMRSTMLIELERFEGVVVFATNFAKNYDDAFVSRIRYHVEFTLPDQEARHALWSRLLVPGIPLPPETDRGQFIQQAAQITDGFSGRELRTVMRTALPRAIAAQAEAPVLRWEDIESAVADVRKAKADVGKSARASRSQDSVNAARAALGVS